MVLGIRNHPFIATTCAAAVAVAVGMYTDYIPSTMSTLVAKSTSAAQTAWGYLSSTSAAQTTWGYLSGETARQAAETAKTKWFGKAAAETAAQQSKYITYGVRSLAGIVVSLTGWAALKTTNKATRAVLGGIAAGKHFITRKVKDTATYSAEKAKQAGKAILGERIASILGCSANMAGKVISRHPFITWNIVLGATAYYTDNISLKLATAGLLVRNILN